MPKVYKVKTENDKVITYNNCKPITKHVAHQRHIKQSRNKRKRNINKPHLEDTMQLKK